MFKVMSRGGGPTAKKLVRKRKKTDYRKLATAITKSKKRHGGPYNAYNSEDSFFGHVAKEMGKPTNKTTRKCLHNIWHRNRNELQKLLKDSVSYMQNNVLNVHLLVL